MAIWAVPFGIAGERLYHVITDPELYFAVGKQPIRALYIWDGGLGIWGAVALGALGAWIGCRRHGMRMAAHPPLPVGLSFVGEDDLPSCLQSGAVQLGHVVERGDGVQESGERGVVGAGWGPPGWFRGVGAEPAQQAVESTAFWSHREDDRLGVVAGFGEAAEGGGDHVRVAEGPFQDERVPVGEGVVDARAHPPCHRWAGGVGIARGLVRGRFAN